MLDRYLSSVEQSSGRRIIVDRGFRRAHELAESAASDKGVRFVGLDHQLIGLVSANSHPVLNSLGINPEEAKQTLLKGIGRGETVRVGESGLYFTAGAKQSIETAVDIAKIFNDEVITVEHLLPAVLHGMRVRGGSTLLPFSADRLNDLIGSSLRYRLRI